MTLAPRASAHHHLVFAIVWIALIDSSPVIGDTIPWSVSQLQEETGLGSASLNALGAVTVYSNVQAPADGYTDQGPAATVSGIATTRLLADDILPTSGGGAPLVQLKLSIVNGNSTAVAASVRIRFFDDDGPAGAPGTLLWSAVTPVTSYAGGTAYLGTAGDGINPFTILPTGKFWAGAFFDNSGGATATQAQLSNFGQAIKNPVTIGSSQDVFFISDSAGSFNGNNPVGGLNDLGGPPFEANFVWEFTVLVPEPPTLILAFCALAALAACVWGRRW